jgi:hypothetical protein
MNLLKAEALKLVYARRTWGLLIASIGISVLSAAFSPYAISKLSNQIGMSFADSQTIDGIYAKALGGYMFVLIIGVLMMTSEFHNHTAISTFLATPKRSRALWAKIVMAVIAGAIINLIATLVGMTGAAVALTFYPQSVGPDSAIFINYPLAAVVIGAVLALIGVGLGALIRNQNVAVTTALVWIFLVDRILGVLFVSIGKYLPTGLITSMMDLKLSTTVSESSAKISINTGDYLDPLPATALLLLYGVVFAAVAMVTTLRRDID